MFISLIRVQIEGDNILKTFFLRISFEKSTFI